MKHLTFHSPAWQTRVKNDLMNLTYCLAWVQSRAKYEIPPPLPPRPASIVFLALAFPFVMSFSFFLIRVQIEMSEAPKIVQATRIGVFFEAPGEAHCTLAQRKKCTVEPTKSVGFFSRQYQSLNVLVRCKNGFILLQSPEIHTSLGHNLSVTEGEKLFNFVDRKINYIFTSKGPLKNISAKKIFQTAIHNPLDCRCKSIGMRTLHLMYLGKHLKCEDKWRQIKLNSSSVQCSMFSLCASAANVATLTLHCDLLRLWHPRSVDPTIGSLSPCKHLAVVHSLTSSQATKDRKSVV